MTAVPGRALVSNMSRGRAAPLSINGHAPIISFMEIGIGYIIIIPEEIPA